MYKTREALKETPCEAIREAYMQTLSTQGYAAGMELKATLQECTAKHLGKLD
jgi:hypothetical protein